MAPENVPTPVFRRNRMEELLQDVSSRFHWFVDVPPDDLHHMTPERARAGTLDAIENGTNKAVVLLVAATGFFTDSYLLFATNAVLPMLEFVYWPYSKSPKYSTAINCVTLAGCFVGMIAFGYLGDKFGRRKLYGIVLMMLFGGTLGVVMSSSGIVSVSEVQDPNPLVNWTGVGSSMDAVAWLVVWRFVSGVGIGGDYPLSAVMVSELSPTLTRGRLLAMLFSMQAFGYAAATVASIIVVNIVRHYHPSPTQVSIDQTWRWVMGLGLIPASIALVMRCFVPESPRFTLYVLNYPFRALQEADMLNQAGVRDRYLREYEVQAIRNFGQRKRDQSQGSSSSSTQREEFDIGDPSRVSVRRKRNSITPRKFWEYLKKDGNGRRLAVTASIWFLLDFTFFGLGFNTPQTMSKIWEGSIPTSVQTPVDWDLNYSNYTTPVAASSEIYTMLIQANVRSLITSSIGAILGAILLCLSIEHFSRRHLMSISFLTLTILFIMIGASYQSTINNYRGVTITLYAITQLCFSFGPNALTFIVAAELFPTRFRCTCHGISAAAGKLGSIIVQIVLAYSKVPGAGSCSDGHGKCGVDSAQSTWLGWILLIFAVPMMLGALVSWMWLPERQARTGEKKGQNMTLEELAEEQRGRIARKSIAGTSRGQSAVV